MFATLAAKATPSKMMQPTLNIPSQSHNRLVSRLMLVWSLLGLGDSSEIDASNSAAVGESALATYRGIPT